MKKKLVLVIAICLVLALTFTLFACGDKDKGNGDNGNTGTGTGDADSQTRQTAPMKTREQITASLGTTYYIVAGAISADGDMTVATNGTYTYKTTPTQVFYITMGDKSHTYTDLRNGKWHEMSTPNVGGDALGTGNVGNIFLYAGETITYNTMETTTYLNRPVTKYTYASNNAYGYNVSYTEEIIIDNATGACLKHDGQGVATDGFTGSNAKPAFVVKAFEYGTNNATAVNFINEQISKIDVYAWDTDFLTQAGLTARTVQTPAGELYSSGWESRSSRDSDEAEWRVLYKLYADEETASQRDAFRAFLQSFYDAGANRNEYGNERAFSQLYGEETEEGEDWQFSFDAYSMNALGETYEITVYVDYMSHFVNKHWQIDVTVEKCAD